MDEVRRLISHFESAVVLYDAHLPSAEGDWQRQLMTHRNWDLSIIADLRQRLVPRD
jgi:hypothetical protein